MSRTLICRVSLALTVAMCGSIARGQENQIVNGEFDDGLNSWNRYGGSGYNMEVVTSAGLSGNYGVVLDVVDSGSATAIGISQSGLLIEPGKTYPIGFQAKAEQDREMVLLLQAQINGSWPTYVNQTMQLTTAPQTYLFEYTHQGDIIGDDPGETLTLYLMLKGAWWPMTGDNLNVKVWFDWVYFGAAPAVQERGRAVDPTPKDGALHEATWVSLGWLPGDFAVSHDVYLGDNFDDVNDGLGDTFRGNQSTTNYVAGFPGFAYPEGLVPGTTYYWRIDEINDADPNSPWRGEVWSFTVPPRIAYGPNPPDGDKFVDPAAILQWSPGLDAKLHTVHFGDNFDDVNDATVDSPVFRGKNSVAGVPQSALTFDPGPLEREKTYYWRVDEFDGAMTRTGDVWSFTVARDGGGLKAEYFNNRNLAGEPAVTRVDPQIDFNWSNGDVPGENSPDAAIGVDEFSARWSGELEVDITETYTFTVGANNGFRLWLDGEPIIDYWDNPTTDSRSSDPIELVAGTSHSIRMEYFEGVDTAIARLSWANGVREEQIIPQAAFSLPVKANTPSPANGADDAKMTAILTWSAGDSATSHEVYFGTDADAVANATTASPEYKGTRTLGSESYDPGRLAWDSTYYWRVDEVDNAAPDGRWIGHVWSFKTGNFLIVDNFEDYDDIDPAPGEPGNRIFDKWIDGYQTLTNGALVGNDLPPYAEQTIVHGGAQSLVYRYDNNLKFSEATLTLVSPRDWTEEGVGELSLWFQGDSANTAERLYVAVANTTGAYAVVYHEDPDAALADSWTQWVIPLQAFADQGIDLTNVDKIAIGFGTRGDASTAGGSGTMYFDDIRLYRIGEGAGQ
ncbi:MAG: carbohydrate binding domain-containing protein [Phycisphaerales bacterium]|nr:MAG: carbohydrate binding domain-containing protein [Phycisphaerales bacterium]